MKAASFKAASLRAAVLTVSDRVSRGEADDGSGDLLADLLRADGYDVERRVVPDEADEIADAIEDLAARASVVLTTGGTGPALRDVTPEATAAVCQRMMPGFGELMRAASLAFVPTAILSRQTAGIRGSTLIINLPGKPKSIRECLDAVFPAVPYCLDLIGAARLETDAGVIKAFRPKQG